MTAECEEKQPKKTIQHTTELHKIKKPKKLYQKMASWNSEEQRDSRYPLYLSRFFKTNYHKLGDWKQKFILSHSGG